MRQLLDEVQQAADTLLLAGDLTSRGKATFENEHFTANQEDFSFYTPAPLVDRFFRGRCVTAFS